MKNGKPLFSQSDIDRTLLIDDQYAVIHNSTKNNLLLSKKFMKYTDLICSK